ncbi:MAG TPA: hypothetical protein VFW09_15220 [Solirubrobacteraceae bacterium]|nr:hypothetical protein [Solirubrobacteraceae bacterium]
MALAKLGDLIRGLTAKDRCVAPLAVLEGFETTYFGSALKRSAKSRVRDGQASPNAW